jgi:hypothetical protein
LFQFQSTQASKKDVFSAGMMLELMEESNGKNNIRIDKIFFLWYTTIKKGGES